MPALYSTEARASGGRLGHVATNDGLLSVDLTAPKELGGKGGATNPEQLFAAGYAACFDSALRLVARHAKAPLTDSAVTATVELHPNGQGGYVLAAAIAVETMGIDQATAEALVARAHKVCPYSNAVHGNIDVPITVKAS